MFSCCFIFFLSRTDFFRLKDSGPPVTLVIQPKTLSAKARAALPTMNSSQASKYFFSCNLIMRLVREKITRSQLSQTKMRRENNKFQF